MKKSNTTKKTKIDKAPLPKKYSLAEIRAQLAIAHTHMGNYNPSLIDLIESGVKLDKDFCMKYINKFIAYYSKWIGDPVKENKYLSDSTNIITHLFQLDHDINIMEYMKNAYGYENEKACILYAYAKAGKKLNKKDSIDFFDIGFRSTAYGYYDDRIDDDTDEEIDDKYKSSTDAEKEIDKTDKNDNTNDKNNDVNFINLRMRTVINKCNIIDICDETLEKSTGFNYIGLIRRAIEKKIKPTNKCLNNIAENGSLRYVKLLLSAGCKLNTETLESACKSNNPDLVKFILDNKIKPNNNCFKNVCGQGGDERARAYTHYLPKRRAVGVSNCSTNIDLLQNAGYKITYEDVCFAAENQVEINNFSLLGIKLKNDFMKLCTKYDFYPSYDMSHLKPDVECLYEACNKPGNLSNIKKMINKYKLKPDIKCLRFACQHKANLQTIKFLMDKGNLTPDLQCVYYICTSCTNNRGIEHIVTNYTKKTLSAKDFEQLIKGKDCLDDTDEEKTISKKSKVSDSSDESGSDSAIDIKTKKVASKKPTAKKTVLVEPDSSDESNSESDASDIKQKTTNKKPLAAPKKATPKKAAPVESDESDSSYSSDSSLSDVKPKKVTNKKVTSKKVTIAVPNDSDSPAPKKVINSDPKKLEEISFSDLSESDNDDNSTKQLEEIPEDYDYREKRKINSNVSKLLGLGKGDYSFTDIRKKFMGYLTKQKLIKSEKIMLNKALADITKLKTTTFCLDDIDGIVYLLTKSPNTLSMQK